MVSKESHFISVEYKLILSSSPKKSAKATVGADSPEDTKKNNMHSLKDKNKRSKTK